MDHFVSPAFRDSLVTLNPLIPILNFQGLGAVASKNSNVIAFHVVVGGMLGAALGLYSVMIYYDMKVR